MARAKKGKKKLLGRSSKGNPVSLQSTDDGGADWSDPKNLAQRRGDGSKGSMGKEPATSRARRPK